MHERFKRIVKRLRRMLGVNRFDVTAVYEPRPAIGRDHSKE
jgi:hypothetical protein